MLTKRDKYEEEINIFKLLWFGLSHWKSIVAIGLIGLVLGCGYAVVSAPTGNIIEGSETETIEQNIVKQLYQYNDERVNDLQDYIEDTKLMTLNPYELYRGAVSYKISASQTEIGAINGCVYSYVINGEMFADLETATGLYNARDFVQLVGINQQYSNVTVISNEQAQGVINTTITVFGESEEQAQKLLSEIEKLVSAYLSKMQGSYAISGYAVEGSNVVEAQSSVLADYQDKIRAKISSEKDSLKSNKAALESAQEVAVQENGGTNKVDLVIYAVVGFVVGCVVAIVLWLVVFFLAGKLYVVSNLEEKFGVKLLGTIHDFKKLKGFDLWIAQRRGGIYSSLPVEEQRKIVLLNIKNELNKNENIKKVFFVSSLGNTCEEAKILREGLISSDIIIEGCENVIGRADVLEKVAQCDAVLVLESNQMSKTVLVEEEISVLKEYVKNVLGMVVLGNKS